MRVNVRAIFLSIVPFFLFFVSVHPRTIDYLVDGDEAIEKQIVHPFILEKLVINADVTVDRAAFLYLTGLYDGVSVDARMVACACFYLKNSGQWQSIVLDIWERSVTFNLKKSWVVRAVRVSGIWFGKEVVRQRYLLKPGEVFDQDKHAESIRQLRIFFKKIGYWNVRVSSFVMRDQREKTVKVKLQINKGRRYRVGDVIITSVGKHQLLLEVKRIAQKEGRSLLKNKFYSARAIASYTQFVRKLLIYNYMPCAHLSTRVVEKGENGLVLHVRLDCRDNNITITGNAHMPYQELVTALFREDEQLRFLSVPFLVHAITAYYHEHGFLDAQVNLEKRHKDWLVTIVEGIQQPEGKMVQEPVPPMAPAPELEKVAMKSLFGKTIIMGADTIRSQRLMNLLAYREDTPFDVASLHATFNRLSDLGIFDSVRVFPFSTTDSYGRLPMMIDVTSGDPFEAQVRAGIVGTNTFSFTTYTFGGSFLAKNITHNADTLTVNAEITRFCRDFSANYRYPAIAGLPISVNVPLFDKKTDVICVGTGSCRLYTALQRGVGLYGEFRNAGMRLMFNAGIEATDITHLCETVAQAILFQPALRDRFISYLYFEPVFYFDSVDDAFNPRTGINAHVYICCMGALRARASSFIRFLAEQSFFIPCAAAITAAVRFRAGYIFCRSFSSLVPSERFYLGGASNVRAYQQDNMVPLACCEQSGCSFWAPIGSRVLLSATVEARITAKNTVGVVLFQDVGVLRDERTGDWCAGGATGIGVRYITPVGPLRFDIGFKNKKVQNDRLPFAWFLTIGQAF